MKKQQIIWVLNISVFLLVLLWVYTATNKLSNISEFERQLSNQPFNRPLQVILLWFIPLSEVLAATLLIFSKTRAIGLVLSLLLMIAFTGYVGLAIVGLYEKRPCSCGGVISAMTWNQHFFFNLFFLLLAIIGLWCEQRSNKLSNNK